MVSASSHCRGGFPFTLLDGKESREACWPVRTCLQNARVPILASVCSEAREVVFEWGGHQVSQDQTSLKSIWLQPKIDTALHLNWTRRRDEEYYSSNNCGDTDFNNSTVEMLTYRAIPTEQFLQSNSCILFNETGENKAIYATVVAISIHVDRIAALASGFFGLQADALLFNSDATLEKAEPYVGKLFKIMLSPEFYAAVLSWQKTHVKHVENFGGIDPRSVWTPLMPPEQEVMAMDQFLPKEDSSWWSEYAEKYLPKVVPQIMLRFCDNQCYKDKRRPEEFGEVYFCEDSVRNVKERGLG
ncbi:hypothetical protein VTL71DRAFT_13706 [Oculimacula yallundae]|uniref:Uncharacterized protein n=1 Tax=Oculimacula yallundae TaxID=86028 RepID=A0ABR4CL76_9HELO